MAVAPLNSLLSNREWWTDTVATDGNPCALRLRLTDNNIPFRHIADYSDFYKLLSSDL